MMEMRYVELNEICDVRDGTHDSPKYVQEGFPLVTSKNIIDGKLDLSTVNYLTQKDYDKINERSKVDRGDIIMPMIGTIGNPLLIGDFYKFAIKNVALIKFPNKNISNRYIWYFLKSDAFNKYVAEKNRGGTQKFLSLNDIRRMKVPYISYFEQISVVEKLDMVYKVIMQRIKELQLLDDLIKARFVEMFGDVIHNDRKWKCMQFSDITTSRLGKMLDTKHQTGTCKYPYLANFNVQWFRFELDNLNEMDFNEKDREEFYLEDGDLLVCEGGEIGRCAVWHNQVKKCFFQKALHRVRCNQDIILPDYLSWWFKYNCENGGFAAIEGAKATISHLTGVKMKMLDVTVPPVELQEQFVDFIHQVDKSKVVVQKALDETQILFNSLMQQYFG